MRHGVDVCLWPDGVSSDKSMIVFLIVHVFTLVGISCLVLLLLNMLNDLLHESVHMCNLDHTTGDGDTFFSNYNSWCRSVQL